MAECRPSSSPASTTLTITVFPDGEAIVSFTRPLQSMYTPRGTWPSTNKTAPAGYRLVNFIFWKSARVSGAIWQKYPSFRMGQVAQSSAISIPYGTCVFILSSRFRETVLGWVSYPPRAAGGKSSHRLERHFLSAFGEAGRALVHQRKSPPPDPR